LNLMPVAKQKNYQRSKHQVLQERGERCNGNAIAKAAAVFEFAREVSITR